MKATQLEGIAARGEERSPFYQKNKAICEAWEQFFISKEGILKGKYSAWALILKGKIGAVNNGFWKIEVNKSTMGGGDSLLFPSAKNITGHTIFELSNIEAFETSFKIMPKRFINGLKTKILPNFQILNTDFIVENEQCFSDHQLAILQFLTIRQTKTKLKKVEYKQCENTLKIEYNGVMEDFDFVEKLVRMEM